MNPWDDHQFSQGVAWMRDTYIPELWSIYQAYLGVGFTADQSFKMVMAQLLITLKGSSQLPPDQEFGDN